MNCYLFAIFLAFHVYLTHGLLSDRECLKALNAWYKGERNFTLSGFPCRIWNETESADNQCRNPDNKSHGMWCYTTNPEAEWEYCEPPECDDNSLLLWSSKSTNTNTIRMLPANPKLALLEESPLTVYTENFQGQFWCMATDKGNNRIFYVNFHERENFLAVHYLNNSVIKKYFNGLVGGVEELAYEPLSKNIYWTDSELKVILVANMSMKSFVLIHKISEIVKPFGIAIHTKKRLLFFTLWDMWGTRAEIVVSDLACKNKKVLLEKPAIVKVKSLTIDYKEDRLYWTDEIEFMKYVVKSSNLNGGDMKTLYRMKPGNWYGIATYLDAIYVADSDLNDLRNYNHGIAVLSKNGSFRKAFNSTMIPKAMAIYGDQMAVRPDEVSPEGECNSAPPCEHVCLPRLNARRECACVIGYQKVGDTGCQLYRGDEDFLYTVDLKLNTIYKISLSVKHDTVYTIAPVEKKYKERVSSITINSRSKLLYWSDENTQAIYKSNLDGSNTQLIRQGVHAKVMDIDPITGNVYFIDSNTRYLNVMDMDGKYAKVLVNSTTYSVKSTINKIAVDPKNKYVYWTDNRSLHQQAGQIRRVRMDGSNQEVVVEKILAARALAINHQRQSLMFATEGDMVMELPLSTLPFAYDTWKHANTTRTFVISNLNKLNYIRDFKVDNTTIYVLDYLKAFIRKYEIQKDEEVQQKSVEFGSGLFYNIDELAIYKKNKLTTELQVNPCEKRLVKCKQLCLPTSSNDVTCACQDGWEAHGVNCIDLTPETLDRPPSYDYCPDNDVIKMYPCDLPIQLNVTAPTWKDDWTAPHDMILTSTELQSSYGEGEHDFLFTATDSFGHIGFCEFSVVIIASVCSETAPRTQDVNVTTLCDGKDYVKRYRCIDDKRMISVGNVTVKNFTNVCRKSGWWSAVNNEMLICHEPVTNLLQNPAVISGIAVGAVIWLIMVILIALFSWRRLRRSIKRARTEVGMGRFNEGHHNQAYESEGD